MPNQSLTNVVPQIMALGLNALREQAVLPRLVNRSYEADARAYGDTIDIPIIDAAAVVTVAPAATYPTAVTVQPDKVQLSLDWWREVSFTLEDKELEEAIAGILPMRASAALKALANAVDTKIFELYKDFPNFGGVGGTTPFAATATAFLDARVALNEDLCPIDGRNVVLDSLAEGNAVGLSQFFKADERGDQGGIINGQIGRKYGAMWYLNQNVGTTHTDTFQAPATTVVCTAVATGASEIQVRVTTATPSLAAGDLFHMTGDITGQGYACVTIATATGTCVTIKVTPDARRSYATTIVVTALGTHAPNLYFHPQGLAWASRPMQRSQAVGQLGSIFTSVIDPISGLAIRLEVSRQWKQVRWTWDILGGAITVRPQLTARILG